LFYNQAPFIGVGLVLENKIGSELSVLNAHRLDLSIEYWTAKHKVKMMEDTINAEQPEQPMPDKVFTQQLIEESGGVKGPEPTRYGDWEKNGRCIDF